MSGFLNWDHKRKGWTNDNEEVKYSHISEAISDMAGWSTMTIDKKLDQILCRLDTVIKLIEEERN